jgi:glyoxylase-like metal-dependent hydrolase (beta-lactamase superfamily II)
MVHIVPKSGFARAYLICEGENIMAVDVGSIGAAHEIEAYCADVLQRSTEAIRFIAATHFHTDHIGGIGSLLRICGPETQVLFHPLVREYLAGNRELPAMKNWISGLLPTVIASLSNLKNPADFTPETLAGIPVIGIDGLSHLPYEASIRYFEAGRLPRYPLGFGPSASSGHRDWEVIATPGHTEDSISLYNNATKELICGDLIIGNQDGAGHLNAFVQDEIAIRETFVTLKYTISPLSIYPGHGKVIKDDENAFRQVRCPELAAPPAGMVEGGALSWSKGRKQA